MTTIVIEGKTLYTDSMHVRGKGSDTFRNTKIAFNESRTIAYAYTGPTLPDALLERLVRLAEFELVRLVIQRSIDVDPKNDHLHVLHEVLNSLYDTYNMGAWHCAECLVLTHCASFHLMSDATVEVTKSEYTGIGCYIPSYGIYRKMGLSPVESFGKIFDFASISAGPVNVAHADMLLPPDALDYIGQIKAGSIRPVLHAIKSEPAKKPVRRVTKPKTK